MFVNLSLPFDDQAVSANAALWATVPEAAAEAATEAVAEAVTEAAAEAAVAAEPETPGLLRAPEALHPALWRADQLGGGLQVVTASGFAVLDAELPGGGWPHRMLTELLLPHAGLGEMRLLAPALAAVARAARSARGEDGEGAGRCVMLFDPPAGLHAGALAALGLDARQWLIVRGRSPHGRCVPTLARRGPLQHLLPSADVLWALEQALKSGHVGAILAWLPAPLKADALRRLQLAAQAHDGPVFVFREMAASHRPSPAPLRLLLQSAGVDRLQLRLLKRRGPPLLRPLSLRLVPVLGPEEEDRLQQQQGAESALAWRLQHSPQAAATAQSRLAALTAMTEQMARLPADPSQP